MKDTRVVSTLLWPIHLSPFILHPSSFFYPHLPLAMWICISVIASFMIS